MHALMNAIGCFQPRFVPKYHLGPLEPTVGRGGGEGSSPGEGMEVVGILQLVGRAVGRTFGCPEGKSPRRGAYRPNHNIL
jgi:hypothetical protein